MPEKAANNIPEIEEDEEHVQAEAKGEDEQEDDYSGPDRENLYSHKGSQFRNVKLMSDVLRRQVTPKGKKMLQLEIDVNQPTYDEEG